MTLLSVFMTNTGVFCFVHIFDRLAESGIVPASYDWRSQLLPNQKEEFLLTAGDSDKHWSSEERHTTRSLLDYSQDRSLTDEPSTNEWRSAMMSSVHGSPIRSLSHSTSVDTFYDRESESSLCDTCNTLLRREIPPDHIPSVIRALALFEAQDGLCGVDFEEGDMAALTNAFSSLRL